MPTVINGIGTWYYGKRRIHTIKGTCEFCKRHTDLESFDTTLFFVVVFVPVIPLQQKRILQQCSVCQQHRVLSLAKWEAAKASDGANVLEKLRTDPNDRDTIMRAISYSVGYQDEPLFNNIVESLGAERSGDAALQAHLGDAYSYFARWPQAAQAYRASLAVEDNEAIREQLAWALLKIDRPDEAWPNLKHVLENKKRDSAGMIYHLIKGYQAQGRHDEALAIMDERDLAFPDWASLKEYKQQRKTSMRYRGSEKKIGSAAVADAKSGYREGNWTASLPRWIAASLALGAVAWYFGMAFWLGQSRKVYLVNGTSRPYTVTIQNQPHTLPPNSSRPIHVAEGEFQVSFTDAKLEPIQGRVETTFWSRPFAGYTFVINPDQSAIVVEEEAHYAQFNPPPSRAPTVHFGSAFYSMPGVDYEFQEFPQTLEVKGNAQVTKTRVALESAVTPETRLSLLDGLDPQEQLKFCQRLLRLEPNNTVFLYWLALRLAPDEAIAFVEPRLDEIPILVEWHRVYQSMMERTHPDTDLRPRYRKLLADTQGHQEAVYLLGRVEPDLEQSEKLYRQAAAANPPSGYAISALGYRALCDGRFAEACRLFEKALPLLTEKLVTQPKYYEALLANGEYDRLLDALQTDSQKPGGKSAATTQMIRVHAIRGDKAKARQLLEEAIQTYSPQIRNEIQKALETILFCWENDAAGYLKALGDTPSFPAAFLQGNLKEAATLVTPSDPDLPALHGLLYLEGMRTNDKERADTQWATLLETLNRGDREQRLFAEILAGKKPLTGGLPQRLPIDPTIKRVLLVVLAQRHPDQAEQMLAAARRLNFQRDAISLCLSKFLKKM